VPAGLHCRDKEVIMSRITALVLCALAALVATATPAPEPKPWVTGWKPVDPKGDCRFERKGDELSVTVPGKDHELGMSGPSENQNGPRMLRDVEGDFVVEVRVSGDSWVASTEDVFRRAGVLVMGDENGPLLTLKFLGQAASGRASEWVRAEVYLPKGGTVIQFSPHKAASPPGRSTHLRLERRGDKWRRSHREDGKQWDATPWPKGVVMKLPRKLKVGVFAEATAEGTFKVTFDHFKLTQPAN
jgi:regulation of enolase protein 1 (concanavalin A-like superfamily)